MKKIICFLIICILSVMLIGCSNDSGKNNEDGVNNLEDKNGSMPNEKIKIGIIQPVEHPSLNEIRESIIKELEELGLSDKVDVVYKDAQGDPSNINTIISQFVNENYGCIIPIGTTPAQAAYASTGEIPIIFAAVSYPVEVGLIEDVKNPNRNITGVSDAIDVNKILNLAKQLTPDIKTIGFIYSAGEANSLPAIEDAKVYCKDNNIHYIETIITNTNELLQAAQSLVSKVDVIFTPTDNIVASAMPILANEAISANIPVYTGADSMVADGGFATMGIDYTLLGKQVASMVKKVVENESISSMPVETLKEYKKVINITTAKKLGIEIPEEILSEFDIFE